MAKRKFTQIRKLILKQLCRGESTVNELAGKTGLTWRTVDNHIIYLIGTGKVEPVFISKYVKIYRVKP